jgi:hypothetical protein
MDKYKYFILTVILMIAGCGGGGTVELNATKSDTVRMNQIKWDSFIGSATSTLN